MVGSDRRSSAICSSVWLRGLLDGARYLPNFFALGRLYTDTTHRSALSQRSKDVYVGESDE